VLTGRESGENAVPLAQLAVPLAQLSKLHPPPAAPPPAPTHTHTPTHHVPLGTVLRIGPPNGPIQRQNPVG
jgi:hypothetical protein